MSTEVTSKDAAVSSWFQPRAAVPPDTIPAAPECSDAVTTTPAGHRTGTGGLDDRHSARNGHGFAASQRDGLNAMIGLAEPDAMAPGSAVRSGAPKIITLATPVLEQVSETAPPIRVLPADSRRS